jgi:NAD(P)-dependent dehydrogenase (short-subunit alcohol dehydrogenase family)
LVTELSRRGHEVVATGRRLADLADLPATQRLVLDLTKPASIAEAGRLEVVINNAAMTVSGPVEAMPATLVEQVRATNVLGPLRVMQAALPTMRERGAGRILNISSPAGRFAPPLEGVYSASKAALEMLSEALRFEAGHFGVQVTIIQPGTIGTDMAEREQKFQLPAYAPLVQHYAERFARYRQRRVPSAEQIASEIADLVDRRSLPLRVPVGLRTERLFARLTPSLLGRLVRSPYKWYRAAPHHTPHRDARRSQPTAAAGGSGRSIRCWFRLVRTSSTFPQGRPRAGSHTTATGERPHPPHRPAMADTREGGCLMQQYADQGRPPAPET